MTETLQKNRPLRLHIEDVKREFNLTRMDIAALHDSELVSGRVGSHRLAVAVINVLVARLGAIQELMLDLDADEGFLVSYSDDEIRQRIHKAINLSDLDPEKE